MMERFPQPPLIELTSNRFETPLKVNLQSYLDFCFWMSEELLDLEARHTRKTNRKPKHEKVRH